MDMEKAEKLATRQIVICGFMGSGKTAVGKLLADQLGREFIDTDQLIEEKLGLSVAEIFDKHGEDYFRLAEEAVVKELRKSTPGSIVLATGGGVLIKEENRKALKQLGPLILLTATPRALLRRINRQGGRPLLEKVKNPATEINVMLARRAEYYHTCDYCFDTTGKTIKQVTADIIRTLGLQNK
jgi:shikimate kinase